MIEPSDLAQLEQNLSDLEKQQNVDIIRITANIDALENYSLKALKNKLNDDNKKSQTQIAVMKKNYDDLQKIIDALNLKAGKDSNGLDDLNAEFNNEDLEKDNDFIHLIENKLNDCEFDINGDQAEK